MHRLLNPYLCCSLQEANKKDKFCSWLPWVCCLRNTCISTWPYLKQVLLFYLQLTQPEATVILFFQICILVETKF